MSFTNTNQENYGQIIFNLVEEFYENGVLNNLKFKESEWTVISSVILQNNNELKIICFSNGTKSLPNKNYEKLYKFFKIYDCHAEILSSRCLKHFLIKCLIFNLIKHDTKLRDNYLEILKEFEIDDQEYNNFNKHSDFFLIFDLESFNKKIKLKQNISFHLYISELPCGDASIAPTFFENKLDCNQTGSKTIEEALNLIGNKKISFDNSVGLFRTKSMRNDIDKDKISYSLSCSDKILFKNIFGVQGKFLYNIMYPIYFSSITVSQCYNNSELISTIKRGVNLLIRNNYENMNNLPFKNYNFYFNDPEIFVVNKSILNTNLKNRTEKTAVPYSLYWIFSKNNFSKIDPVNGYKQGTNANQKNIEKCRVDICTYELLKIILKMLNIYSHTENKFSNKIINKIILKINSLITHDDKIKLEDIFPLLINKNYMEFKSNILEEYKLLDFLNIKYKKLN